MGRGAGASAYFLSFFPKNEWFLYLFTVGELSVQEAQWLSLFYCNVHGFFVQDFIGSLLAKNENQNSTMSQGVIIPLHQYLEFKSIFNDQISNYKTGYFIYYYIIIFFYNKLKNWIDSTFNIANGFLVWASQLAQNTP